jgi:hypothetical protein
MPDVACCTLRDGGPSAALRFASHCVLARRVGSYRDGEPHWSHRVNAGR